MIPFLQAAGSLFGAGAAAAPGPDLLESSLSAKINPTFANSFAVGSGADATSSPTVSGDAAPSLPIPTEYLVVGGILFVAVFALVLRK